MQPNPKENKNTPIIDLVKQDLDDRARQGLKTYGTYLQANNGRKSIIDLYEELQDACMYVRQLIEEERISGKSDLELKITMLVAQTVQAEKERDYYKTELQYLQAENQKLNNQLNQIKSLVDEDTYY